MMSKPIHPSQNEVIPTENRVDIAEKEDDDMGFIDSMLGKGTQEKILESVKDWVTEKAKANPGCVERFVCESYRTGEGLTGLPYLFMQITNAAISFMVAETFDQSIDIQEITKAARFGRDANTCEVMKCDVMDGQLRTLGDFLNSLEEFVSSIVGSLSNSINIGKRK